MFSREGGLTLASLSPVARLCTEGSKGTIQNPSLSLIKMPSRHTWCPLLPNSHQVMLAQCPGAPGNARLSTAAGHPPHLRSDLLVGLLQEGPTEAEPGPQLETGSPCHPTGLGQSSRGAHRDLKVCRPSPHKPFSNLFISLATHNSPKAPFWGASLCKRRVILSDGTKRARM